MKDDKKKPSEDKQNTPPRNFSSKFTKHYLSHQLKSSREKTTGPNSSNPGDNNPPGNMETGSSIHEITESAENTKRKKPAFIEKKKIPVIEKTKITSAKKERKLRKDHQEGKKENKKEAIIEIPPEEYPGSYRSVTYDEDDPIRESNSQPDDRSGHQGIDFTNVIRVVLQYLTKPFFIAGVGVLLIILLALPLFQDTDGVSGKSAFSKLFSTIGDFFSGDSPEARLEKNWEKFREMVYQSRLPGSAVIEKGKLYSLSKNKPQIPEIARTYLPFTTYHSLSSLRDALSTQPVRVLKNDNYREKVNAETVYSIEIPGYRPYTEVKTTQVKKQISNPRDSRKGLYLLGQNAGSNKIHSVISQLKRIGANSIVFDIKDVVGYVNFSTRYTVAEKFQKHEKFGYQVPIRDLPKLVQLLRKHQIYSIARVAVFQDMHATKIAPSLSIKSNSGGLLLHKGKPLWLDPGLTETQNYNLEIVYEVALAGVDEVQFDYIRYPAEGNLSGIVYHNVKSSRDKTRNLRNFLMKAQSILHAHNVLSSIDVFGIVAWEEKKDIQSTGQDLEQLAYFTDVISPMLYPSHFNKNFEGIKNPADAGFYFIHKGCVKVREVTKDRVVVRPWLQAFKWKVSNYSPAYIQDQINGVNKSGAVGWLMWNAGNNYDMVQSALASQQKNVEPN